MLSINFIGCGKLGKTLGFLLQHQRVATIGGIINTSLDSAQQACEFIGAGTAQMSLDKLPSADLTFIAVPDDHIKTVADRVANGASLKPGSIFVHCSGFLPADVMAALQQKGYLIASAHPMCSFADPNLSIQSYPGTYCAIEGDAAALPTIERLFQGIGSITYRVNASQKGLYHAAGVFASNYLVSLNSIAAQCLIDAGVSPDTAQQVIARLMQVTLQNLEKTGCPKKSLTGPIKRGDCNTVAGHLASLSNDRHRRAYQQLGLEALSLSDLSDERAAAINEILQHQSAEKI